MAQDDGFIPVSGDDGFIPVNPNEGFIPSTLTGSPVTSPDLLSALADIPDITSQRLRDAWNTLQRGARDIVGIGHNIAGVPGGPSALDIVAAPGRMLMGAMGVSSPIGQLASTAAEQIHKGLGEPLGAYGTAGAGLLGGLAGGMGELSLLSQLPTVSKVARTSPTIIKEAETAIAPATAIRPIEATAGGAIAGLEQAPRSLSAAEQRLVQVNPNVEGSPYLQVLREAVEKAVKTDKQVVPIGGMAEDMLTNIQSPEFRAFSQVVTDTLKNSGYSDEAIVAFLNKQAKLLYGPSGVAPQLAVDRGTVSRQIARMAEKDQALAETLGIPYKPPKTSTVEQQSLFGRTVEPTPATIERYGPTQGSTYETGNLIEKTLGGHQGGQQLDLFGRPPTFVAKTADPDTDIGFLMKTQNAIIKSTTMMTSALQTGLRNFMAQGAKNTIEIPLQAIQEIAQSGSITQAWKKAADQASGMWDRYMVPGIGKQVEAGISRLSPGLQEEFARKGMYGEYLDLPTFTQKIPGTSVSLDKALDVGIKGITMANRAQEKSYWYSNFISAINSTLPKGKRFGVNVTAGEISDKVLQDAANHAAEMTYSSRLPEKIDEWYKTTLRTPVLGLVMNATVPFARFNFGNALRDVIDFSPAGLVRATLSESPELAARRYAKAFMGTKILEQFVRLKEDPKIGVWEIPIPGGGKINFQKWHPFDSFVWLAEVINRPPGSPNARVKLEDLENLITGGTRLEDTAAGLLTRAKDLTTEGATHAAGQFLSDLAARWTVPGKWGTDIQALVTGNPSIMADRDILTGKYGLLDKAIANIPGLRQTLPERVDPTLAETPGPKNRAEYIMRLMGLEPVPSSTLKDELKRLTFTGPQGNEFANQLYDQLDRMGLLSDESQRKALQSSLSAGDFSRKIFASTGDPELNRRINILTRDIVRPKLEELINNPLYRGMSIEKQRFVMNRTMNLAREATKSAALATSDPATQINYLIKQMDPLLRGVLDDAVRTK